MSAETILSSDLFRKCLDFHGHLCPGLAMGYQAAVAGMQWLAARRSEDEEIVAVVETDACGCDAIQVVTGCTFGKGNFIYRDYGKHAFTFFNRKTGQGVRVARKTDPQASLDPEHHRLLDKIREDTASPEERAEFNRRHQAACRRILDQAPEALFTLSEVSVPLPEKARIQPSVTCARCGEPTMATKLETVDGRQVCRGCLG